MKRQNNGQTGSGGPIRRIMFATIRSNRKISAGLAASVAGAIILNLLPPLVLGSVIDRLTRSRNVPVRYAFLYFALLAAGGLMTSVREALITVFGQKMTHALRSRMSEKMLRLPSRYFTSHESGEVTSLFVNDVDTVEDLFSSGVISMCSDLAGVISVMAVIFTKSRGLGLLMTAAAVILFVMTRLFQIRTLRAQIENRRAIGRASAQIPETIRNIRMIHVFHAEKYMENVYDDAVDDSFQAMERANFFDAVYSPIVLTVSSVIIAVMMAASGQGDAFRSFFGVTVGTSVTLIAYVGKVFGPLESIGMEIQNIQSASAGLTRIREFLALPDMQPNGSASPTETEKEAVSASSSSGTDTEEAEAGRESYPKRRGNEIPEEDDAVRIDRLCFGYDEDHTIFSEYSLIVRTGETVVLTGRTGIGKSTLFRLILGLLRPDRGTVRVFGEDPSRISPSLRRRLFGYVEQTFRPVPGTVLDQITLGDPAVSTDDAQRALSLVGLPDIPLDLPFSESRLSRGQEQLLGIARAVVLNPRLLLLDEVTASLDAGTEKTVLGALRAASEGRTVISVSHRLYETMGGRTEELV